VSSRRPLPVLTTNTREFWTGGAHGDLLIYRCQACGYYVHPATHFCPKCESRDVAPDAVSGRATIASFTVNHQQWEPELEVPYVMALVELEEQADVRLVTNIVNCPIEDVYIGMPVSVLFEQNDDVWVPLFQPREAP
jgi:uncharacterized OB-fold protein